MDEPQEKPKFTWGLKHTGVATALLGSLQVYGMTEYLYTRHEADQLIKNQDEMRVEQKDIRDKLYVEMIDMHTDLNKLKVMFEQYMRERDLRADGKVRIKAPIGEGNNLETKNQGG